MTDHDTKDCPMGMEIGKLIGGLDAIQRELVNNRAQARADTGVLRDTMESHHRRLDERMNKVDSTLEQHGEKIAVLESKSAGALLQKSWRSLPVKIALPTLSVVGIYELISIIHKQLMAFLGGGG